jgi:hypothetical protein
MGDQGVLAGLVLVALTTLVVLAALLAGLGRPAGRRAGLVAGGLPLALLPPVLTSGYGSWRVIRQFSDLMQASAAPGELATVFSRLWLPQRVAWGAFGAACLVGLAVCLSSLLAPSGDTDAPRCSPRRGVVLLLLPVLALLVAGLAARPLARALRVSSAVVPSDPKDPGLRKRGEAVLAEEGFATTGSRYIGRVSAFISQNLMLGVLGGILAGLVLVGLALPGFILSWRVAQGPAFTAAASALWLVAAAGGVLVAAGALDPVVRP